MSTDKSAKFVIVEHHRWLVAYNLERTAIARISHQKSYEKTTTVIR
jgi:hypothetical protein